MSFDFLNARWVESGGWALLHSLWQCTVVAIAAATLLGWLRGRLTVSGRYWLLCGAMLMMVALPIGTYGWMLAGMTGSGSGAVGAGPAIVSVIEQPESNDLREQALAVLAGAAPWIFWVWTVGVGMSFLKLLRSWRFARKLTTWQAAIAPEEWRGRFERIARGLGVAKRVELRSSLAATVPCLIGWFKPVVLVPASAFAGMDAARLEAILAHELAHVVRNDYPISVLQGVAEALFFYHPAVWWASEKVSAAREQCCDDIAVEACGDVATYVMALSDLEVNRQAAALAASDGSLVARVRRLLGVSESQERFAAPFAGLASAAVSLLLIASLTIAQTPRETTPSRDGLMFQSFDESRTVKEKKEAISRISGSGSAAAWKKLSTIAENDPEQAVREEAVSYIAGRANEAAARELIRLYDSSRNAAMRMHVLSYLSGLTASPVAKSKVAEISRNESDPAIRAKAIDYVLGR